MEQGGNYIEGGYFVVPRRVCESKWYSKNLEYKGLIMFVFEKANHTEAYSYGEICKKGQFFCSGINLSETLNIKRTKLNRMLKNLEADNIINIKADSQKTCITICKYEDYQNTENYIRTASGQPADSKQTASGQQADTSNKLINKKYIFSAREKEFINNNFSQEVKTAFSDYCASYFENNHTNLTDNIIFLLLKQLRELPEVDRVESINDAILKKYKKFYPINRKPENKNNSTGKAQTQKEQDLLNSF